MIQKNIDPNLRARHRIGEVHGHLLDGRLLLPDGRQSLHQRLVEHLLRGRLGLLECNLCLLIAQFSVADLRGKAVINDHGFIHGGDASKHQAETSDSNEANILNPTILVE